MQNNQLELYNFEIFAKEVVEGFITGMHKSPFHGFSVEFAEHRLYNKGESTQFIDWKLYAKTKKLFVKQFEEETNLRCHIIIDNSASMHFPVVTTKSEILKSKIGFSVYATAVLSEILKRQHDAIGLSVYSNVLEYSTPSKGNNKHRRILLNHLQKVLETKSTATTKTYQFLHQIAEKIHKRSLIFLFTDMFQTTKNKEELFDALRHLKYNKHDVVLFHTYSKELEIDFNFDDSAKKIVDIETNEEITIYPSAIKENYRVAVEKYFNELKMNCLQYKIDYVPVNISEGFNQILTAYFISRKRFL